MAVVDATPDPTPDLVGFADALERKRQDLGSDVVFLQPAVVTLPPGTAVDELGDPYDPTVVPTSSAQASATVRCGVFFKAVNRGGAANAQLDEAIGELPRTRVFAVAPISAFSVINTAVVMIFHGDRFRIDSVKVDEVLQGVKRVLVYAAAEGNT